MSPFGLFLLLDNTMDLLFDMQMMNRLLGTHNGTMKNRIFCVSKYPRFKFSLAFVHSQRLDTIMNRRFCLV